MIKIQDSFYTDVESIRKLAENACQLTGCGPAVRSDYINNIDYNFYEWFCKNIANEYNLNLNNVLINPSKIYSVGMFLIKKFSDSPFAFNKE